MEASSYSACKRALALSVPMLFAACGPPVIYDTELIPVRNPLITASVENGWLAVDSTEAGYRAVLELQIEGAPVASEYVTLHTPELRCSSRGVHRPVKVLHETPVCTTVQPSALDCSPGQREAGLCQAAVTDETESCLFVVRAEYLFEQVPHLDESHYFTFAQTETPVYWTRRP